jgi:hypothetical protein
MVLLSTRVVLLKPHLYREYRFFKGFFQKYFLSGFDPRLELTLEMVELDVEFNSGSNGTICN